MKLLLAIISNDDTKACVNTLNKGHFSVTKLATTGGFLSAGNTTLIIGVKDEEVDKCIELIGSECKRRKESVPTSMFMDVNNLASFPMEVEIGGATIFILDVDQFVRL